MRDWAITTFLIIHFSAMAGLLLIAFMVAPMAGIVISILLLIHLAIKIIKKACLK